MHSPEHGGRPIILIFWGLFTTTTCSLNMSLFLEKNIFFGGLTTPPENHLLDDVLETEKYDFSEPCKFKSIHVDIKFLGVFYLWSFLFVLLESILLNIN